MSSLLLVTANSIIFEIKLLSNKAGKRSLKTTILLGIFMADIRNVRVGVDYYKFIGSSLDGLDDLLPKLIFPDSLFVKLDTKENWTFYNLELPGLEASIGIDKMVKYAESGLLFGFQHRLDFNIKQHTTTETFGVLSHHSKIKIIQLFNSKYKFIKQIEPPKTLSASICPMELIYNMKICGGLCTECKLIKIDNLCYNSECCKFKGINFTISQLEVGKRRMNDIEIAQLLSEVDLKRLCPSCRACKICFRKKSKCKRHINCPHILTGTTLLKLTRNKIRKLHE